MKSLDKLSGDEARSIGSAMFWSALYAAKCSEGDSDKHTRVAIQSALRAMLVLGAGAHSVRLREVFRGMVISCQYRLRDDDAAQLRTIISLLEQVEWESVDPDTTALIFRRDHSSSFVVWLNQEGQPLLLSTIYESPEDTFLQLRSVFDVLFLNP